MIPPASTPETSESLAVVADVKSAFYLAMEVDDEPGVLAQVAEVLGMQGASIKSVVQRGLGGRARLVMVIHPLLESRFYGAVQLLGADAVRARGTACHPRARRGVQRLMGLITRYADRLPFAPGDPIVTLEEGSTPLVLAERLSERVKAEVWLKVEGANPTGSFKDRGMTVRGRPTPSATAPRPSSAPPPATPRRRSPPTPRAAGLRGAVIVPDGKIATGKLAQALMHGARVIALRGNFDEALKLVRELAAASPDRARQQRQPVPPRRPEDRGVRAAGLARRRSTRSASRSATRATSRRTGRASRRWAPRRALFGFQAEGAAPLVLGKPVANPETVASAIRIGNPARWEEAMEAFTGSRGRVAAVSDAQILDAYRFLAATRASSASPRRAASVAGLLTHGAEDAERIVCVLTGQRPQGPADRAVPGRRRRAVRARDGGGREGRPGRVRRRGRSASPRPRPTSGRGST